MESESEIRDMLKTPESKTAAELVSGNNALFNNLKLRFKTDYNL